MEQPKNDIVLAKATDWVEANRDHPFATAIETNISTATLMPEFAGNMIAAIKSMLKDQAGNPFGRGNSVLNAQAKTTFDVGHQELDDLLNEAALTHPIAMAMLMHTQRGPLKYTSCDELSTSLISSAKRVLTDSFKAKTWDGSVEGL
tara:strand:+ start:17396 stop:17836 length:441 start_codon:yes stop_codon:yes gene_type:complete